MKKNRALLLVAIILLVGFLTTGCSNDSLSTNFIKYERIETYSTEEVQYSISVKMTIKNNSKHFVYNAKTNNYYLKNIFTNEELSIIASPIDMIVYPTQQNTITISFGKLVDGNFIELANIEEYKLYVEDYLTEKTLIFNLEVQNESGT